MKRCLVLMLVVIGCGDDASKNTSNSNTQNNGTTANNTVNSTANNTANNTVNNSGNNVVVLDSLNALSETEAQALCEAYLDEDGYLECSDGFIEVTPPVFCGEWFAELPDCATVTHFRDCAAEACFTEDSSACAAIMGECSSTNNTVNNTSNNTSNNTANNTANNTPNPTGDKGDACQHPDKIAGGTATDEYGSTSGNTNGCKYSFSATKNLSCLYDLGTEDGTCVYTCSENDEGVQGSCLDGDTCVNSGKQSITGSYWYVCE